MFLHYIFRHHVSIYDIPSEMLELTKRRRSKSRNGLRQKGQILRQLSSSCLGIPRNELHLSFHEYNAYALQKFLHKSVLKSSNYRVDRSFITIGENMSSTRRSMLGVDNTNHIRIAAFVVTPINQQDAKTRKIFVYTCKSKMNGDAIFVTKAFWTCLGPVSNGFPCVHMARVATVHAEELSRKPELSTIVESRYPLEQLFHPY